MAALTSLDLFAGAGGITEGFRLAGVECLWANDLMPEARETFAINHPSVAFDDHPIEDIDEKAVRRGLGLAKGELDCLVGGPPCQGFSINAPGRFIEDPRNLLFKRFIDFVAEFEPKAVMFENVPGLLSLGKGFVLDRLIAELGELGYDAVPRILLAANYGVPQERWRLIVLASRNGEVEHPKPTHHWAARANFSGGRVLALRTADSDELLPRVSVRDALGDLPPIPSGGGTEVQAYPRRQGSAYARWAREGSKDVVHHVAPGLSPINIERLKHIPPGGSWRDIPFELLPAGMQRARRSDHTKRYGRLEPEGLASTVMTKMDPHWGPAFHYEQDRVLSVREAARLQSFPDHYRFAGSRVSQYVQVGNAVPVLLANAVAHEIKRALHGRLKGRANGTLTARVVRI